MTTRTIAHRSTRRYAQSYIDSFADELGDQTRWNGQRHIPIHVTWIVVPAATGGFDVVSTVTERTEAK
jgi:hypothetical protein